MFATELLSIISMVIILNITGALAFQLLKEHCFYTSSVFAATFFYCWWLLIACLQMYKVGYNTHIWPEQLQKIYSKNTSVAAGMIAELKLMRMLCGQVVIWLKASLVLAVVLIFRLPIGC